MSTAAEPAPSMATSRNWRVLTVRFVVNALLITLVLLLPGVRAQFDLGTGEIAILAIVYGLLNEFIRPLLNLVLMPYLVQSYGLIVIAVDVVVFGLLVWISGEIEINSLLVLIAAGGLLGLARFVMHGLFGLNPPVVEVASARPPPRAPSRAAKLLPAAGERLRVLRVREKIIDHGVDAAFNNTGVIGSARRRLQAWLWRPPVPIVPLDPPVRFRLLLQELGPTYVKIGQLISSQARTLPPEWEAELEKLQSDVRPFPYEEARARIVEELGAPPEQLYAWFDTEPLAAASLAQVHRATTHEGRDVAVKIQRPAIHARLRSDVRILARLADTLEHRARWARGLGLSGIFIEFGTTLLRELDYKVEAYNARRLAAGLADIDGVRVPEVIYSLSSSAVLTLEFVPGVKSTDADALDAAGVDRVAVAENMVRAAVKMLVIDGFFHADPHPGNVFVDLDTSELTLLDTGMVGELTIDQRLRLVSVLTVTRNGDINGLAHTLKSLSTPFRETDDTRYYKDFERSLTPYLDPPPGEQVELVNKVMPTAMDLLFEAGYRVDREYTLALKALAQAEAISSALVPAWTGQDFTDRATDAAMELIPEAITPEAIKTAVTRQATFAVREVAEQMPSLQDGIVKWVENLRRGAVKVELDTTGLDVQMKALRGIFTMITLGLLVSGLVIGSAIAAGVTSFEGGPLERVTDVAGVMFVAASTAGILAVVYLFVRLVRGGRSEQRRAIDRL